MHWQWQLVCWLGDLKPVKWTEIEGNLAMDLVTES